MSSRSLPEPGSSNYSQRHYRDFYLEYPHIVGSLHPQLQRLLLFPEVAIPREEPDSASGNPAKFSYLRLYRIRPQKCIDNPVRTGSFLREY